MYIKDNKIIGIESLINKWSKELQANEDFLNVVESNTSKNSLRPVTPVIKHFLNDLNLLNNDQNHIFSSFSNDDKK